MLMTILESDGHPAKKKGPNEYASSCPACGGRDRFIIRTDGKARYWCRQCSISGDAIEYLRKFRGMSYREAAEFVGKHVDEPVTWKARPDDRSAPIARPSEAWIKRAEMLIERTIKSLLESESAMTWLLTERGLTRATVEHFRLGWIERDLYDQRAAWGLPDELKDDGRKKKLFIPSGLVIPGPARIRIRRNNPGDYGRYHVLPGSSPTPMTIGTPYENTAIIVESELDAILLCQEIDRPIFVVALGSTSIKPDSAIAKELVSRLYDCPVVLLALDSDTAGGKAARQWLDEMHNAYRAMIPQEHGKDITDAYLRGVDLNDWLSAAMDLCCEEATNENHQSYDNDINQQQEPPRPPARQESQQGNFFPDRSPDTGMRHQYTGGLF